MAPLALLERVDRIPTAGPMSQSWTTSFRRAAQLTGSVIASVIGVAILSLAFGQHGTSPAGSTASPSRSAFCGQAVIAVRIGHSGSTVTFNDAETGAVAYLTFPTGFTTSIASGSAELLAPDGTVVAREGETLALGGGGSGSKTFAVCTVNGVNYP